MAYDKTEYDALRSAGVPERIALALAKSGHKTIKAQNKQTDLNTGTATTAQIATQLNALEAILVTAGVLK